MSTLTPRGIVAELDKFVVGQEQAKRMVAVAVRNRWRRQHLAPELRDGLSRHIASTMRAWNDEDLVREIEHSVGRDLQFIRLNGTVVGGLIGVALYAVTHLIT